MANKKEQRLRRARQTRIRIAKQDIARLSVNRSNLHTYATVFSADGERVIAAVSTTQAALCKALEQGASGKSATVAAAALVGAAIAEKAKAAGVERVAFDRAGFAYHGRIKALAEAARAAGLQF